MNANTQQHDENPADWRSDSNGGLGLQTMTDEMAKAWDTMGLTESMQIERIQDWANMLEKRVAEFDPLYRAYPWGRNSA